MKMALVHYHIMPKDNNIFNENPYANLWRKKKLGRGKFMVQNLGGNFKSCYIENVTEWNGIMT